MLTAKDLEDLGLDYYTPRPSDKPSVFDPEAMMKQFKEVTGQEPNPGLYIELIQEEYEEFLASQNDEECIKELADMAYVLFGFAYSMGWDLAEAMRRVHENNIGRVVQPDGTVKRREDGKILKNKDFPKPDLKDLVKKP